jgi:hypothetical protein
MYIKLDIYDFILYMNSEILNSKELYRQYTYIVGKYKIYLYELFCPVSQHVQINYIFPNYVCILYLSCNIKNPKTTAKLSKKSKNKHHSNHLLMVSSVKSALNTVTVSYRRSTWILYQKNYILVSDHI